MYLLVRRGTLKAGSVVKVCPMYALRHLSKSLALLACLTVSAAAQAQSSGSFDCITNNSASSCAQAESGLGWAFVGSLFSITNNSTGYVSEVYFDVGTGVGVTFAGGAGTSFIPGASPGNLPGGNTVSFVSDFTFDSDGVSRGRPVWGINTGETATFQFTGPVGGGFDSGALAAGVHVRSLVNGQSEGLTTVTAVPEPGTYAMILAGLAAMGFVARRRRQV